MTFFRVRLVPTFYYNLNGETLHRTMGPIKNLGIFFPKLKFDCHIIHIVNRSNKTMGFFCRNHADFNETLDLKSVYCYLVCPVCEYGSTIWSPYT